MKKASALALLMAAVLLAAPFLPLGSSKSDNPCASCHGNRSMYLDILEGDPGNILPSVLNDSETRQVAVVIEVTTDVTKNNIMTAISATLSSQNGLFSVATPIYNIGALGNGQRATAFWNMTSLAEGNDVLVMTAQGHNNHKNQNFNDAYTPAPSIAVHKAAPDLAPSIALASPAAGAVVTGGSDLAICWTVTDEDRPTCLVSLYYSTDDFASSNQTIATGVPATQGFTWTTPLMDSATVRIKATVKDSKDQFNQTLLGGTFSIDSTPPSILSVLPLDNEDDVGVSAPVVVTFSEPVVTSTAQAAFGISPDPGGISWSWNPANTVMTASHNAFTAGTDYTCTMASGVKDLSTPGNSYQGTLIWNFSTAPSVVPVPSMNLTAPAGGERFYWDDQVTARWTATGGTGTLSVNLSISDNGTSGPFAPIATGVANSGQHSFALPHIVSDNCVIRATVLDENGMEAQATSGLFAVAQDLSLSAVLPPAGSMLRVGGNTTIGWTATGGHGTVQVEISFKENSGSQPQIIFSGKPPAGSVVWTVPQAGTDSASIIVNATDDWGGSAMVTSGQLAIYTNRLPKFDSSPKNTARAAVPYEYAANASDPDGDAIVFSLVTDATNMTINASTGKVQWTPTQAGSFNVTIRISDGHGGEATQQFTVAVAAKTPATVTIGSPAAGQKVKGTVNITGTATRGTLDITKVQVKIGSNDWADATGTASWQLTIDTTKLKNGRHTIQVRAYDGADFSDVVNGTLDVSNIKAGNKVSVPMLDGLVIIGLFAAVGGILHLRRK